jgi:hypothetical protein
MFQHDIICNMLKLRILSLVLHWLTGLTNSAHFAEIRRNSTDSGRSEFKNRRIYCPVFQNFRKDKNQQKICKKTRSNSKVTGEEIFCKTRSFGLVKFKFIQMCSVKFTAHYKFTVHSAELSANSADFRVFKKFLFLSLIKCISIEFF